jgi:hypothetical protein
MLSAALHFVRALRGSWRYQDRQAQRSAKRTNLQRSHFHLEAFSSGEA